MISNNVSLNLFHNFVIKYFYHTFLQYFYNVFTIIFLQCNMFSKYLWHIIYFIILRISVPSSSSIFLASETDELRAMSKELWKKRTKNTLKSSSRIVAGRSSLTNILSRRRAILDQEFSREKFAHKMMSKNNRKLHVLWNILADFILPFGIVSRRAFIFTEVTFIS